MLTFGVEFEFALAVLRPEDKDKNPTDPRPVHLTGKYSPYNVLANESVYQRIAWALQNAGIDAAPLTVAEDGNSEVPLIPDASGPHSLLKYDKWGIKEDGSIQAPDASYYYYPIELVSPPLYMTEGSISDVRNVCETIPSNFRVNSNQSCGLHVHVGDGVNGFDLPTLKSLLAMLWIFEPQIETIHPQHRLESHFASGLYGNTYLSMLSMHGSQGKRLPGLDIIYAVDSINKLLELLSAVAVRRYRGAYNFAPQTRPFGEYDLKRTIEFRQHEATLDADRVENWIRVCEGIMRYAKNTPFANVERFCRANADRSIEKFTLRHFLVELGLRNQALYYEIEIRKRKANGGKTEDGNNTPVKYLLIICNYVDEEFEEASDGGRL